MITLAARFIAIPALLQVEPQRQVGDVRPSRLHEYAVDPGHSIVEFSIGFALTRVKGRFTHWHGTILYDSLDPGNSSITAIIETKTIDTGWPNRDRHLRTSDFFDVEHFPTISFRSERLRQVGDSWIAEGPFSMHGVTKQVSLAFRFLPSSPSRTAESRNMILNVSGSVRLARSDFGILGGSTYNGWFTRARNATMSDSVDISFEVEAWRADDVSVRPTGIDEALVRITTAGIAAHRKRLRDQRAAVSADEWPKYFRGQDFLVRALLASNRRSDAVSLAKTLPDLFPASSSPYLILGFAHASAGDREAAASAYARAKEVHRPSTVDPSEPFPQDDESWYYLDQLVRTALEAGHTNEPLGLARVLTELHPRLARAHSRYGQALALAGRYREADAAFTRALDLDPNETRALEYRRRLLK